MLVDSQLVTATVWDTSKSDPRLPKSGDIVRIAKMKKPKVTRLTSAGVEYSLCQLSCALNSITSE